VPSRVQQHVCNRGPDLAWVPEDVEVKALREDTPAASEHAIHRPGDARAERHHPATERGGVGRLDDEVGVRALQRVVDEAKVAALADGAEAALERADHGEAAERGHAR